MYLNSTFRIGSAPIASHFQFDVSHILQTHVVGRVESENCRQTILSYEKNISFSF